MKKLVTLVLALALVLGCFNIASAETDVTKITWAMGCGSTAPVDNAKFLEWYNQYLAEKIGVELDMQYFTNDQLQLAINAGELFDIYFTCSWYNNTNQCISKGLFLGLSQDYIKEVAPGLYDAMSKDVWDLAESADGLIYAIPNKNDYAAENFITYPADKATELGYEIPAKIEAWSDLTDFLVDWKETLADGEYPVLVGGNPAGMESSFDFIDRTAMIGCVYGTTEVVSVFEDEEVMERYRTMYDWMQKGLVNPDAAQLSESAIDSSKPHIGFAQAWDSYDGYTISNGYTTWMTRYAGPMLSVDSVQGSMNAVSAALANDEDKLDKVLALFELLHTDKYAADCLRYGIEGVHWNYITEGPCAGAVLRTQEGSDNYSCWAFAQPMYFFTSLPVSAAQVEAGIAPAFDQYEIYYGVVADEAVPSAMGSFKWDSSAFTDQLAEISAIKESYYTSFASGTVLIDDIYDEFIEKMNAAGLQDMIEDAQRQLDEYLANN